MARNEADREDLLAEAIALTRRVEIQTVTESSNIVIGFRTTGWLSIYFGQDLMYQFDEVGRFRRGFAAGMLYRTQGNTIAQMHRQRSETETTLVRRDLSSEQLRQFQERLHDKIRSLQSLLASGAFVVLRRIPDEDIIPEVITFQDRILASQQFLAPAIKR